MRYKLDADDLDRMPAGASVEDSDGDTWDKDSEGDTWTLPGCGISYRGWSAYRLADEYSVYYLEGEEPQEAVTAEPTVEGVWIVWDSISKECVNGIFPADGEINALRMVNRDGYGHAEFQPFGEA